MVVERWVKASPQTVFGFLTDPDKWVRWQGTRAELDPRPGGIYRVHVRAGVTASGQFVEVRRTAGSCSPGASSSPTTRSRRAPPWSRSTSSPTATTRWFGSPRSGCAGGVVPVHRGWEDYLDRLQTVAAGGDPGPDPGGVPQPTQGT